MPTSWLHSCTCTVLGCAPETETMIFCPRKVLPYPICPPSPATSLLFLKLCYQTTIGYQQFSFVITSCPFLAPQPSSYLCLWHTHWDIHSYLLRFNSINGLLVQNAKYFLAFSDDVVSSVIEREDATFGILLVLSPWGEWSAEQIRRCGYMQDLLCLWTPREITTYLLQSLFCRQLFHQRSCGLAVSNGTLTWKTMKIIFMGRRSAAEIGVERGHSNKCVMDRY